MQRAAQISFFASSKILPPEIVIIWNRYIFVHNNNGHTGARNIRQDDQQNFRSRCGGVEEMRNRILTLRGARFFFASHAAWEAHFLFFQHLCGERITFLENRFVRTSVESSRAIFGHLHVLTQ